MCDKVMLSAVFACIWLSPCEMYASSSLQLLLLLATPIDIQSECG